ncbi:GNAT family N-acetyltransferase [Candidatus Nitrosotalea bavarica]|uniref:GNAT family N-acetyltransferase n=1 Tax=Candidatus Nitrosotalea bavarica TaxID=1903277 RepID=UPI000C6FEC57|nr:GNAT family N-acetyltransferase [Candidatus Nitrosotalea bavarica]
MQKTESNDNGFSEIWSVPSQLECGTLFLNPKLAGDLFFNKLTNVTCISEKMIMESMKQFQKNHSVPYVYSQNYPELEIFLKSKGFVYHDTQHVLKKRTLPSKKPNAIKITHDTISLWTGIFCESYDCREWAEPVSSILKNSISLAEYYVDESSSSCMVLYEKNSILGLYCLGTVPSRRKQGSATSLIDFALHEVHSRNLEFLMLETFERDNLSKFYSNLGFESIYQKNIYTI